MNVDTVVVGIEDTEEAKDASVSSSPHPDISSPRTH